VPDRRGNRTVLLVLVRTERGRRPRSRSIPAEVVAHSAEPLAEGRVGERAAELAGGEGRVGAARRLVVRAALAARVGDQRVALVLRRRRALVAARLRAVRGAAHRAAAAVADLRGGARVEARVLLEGVSEDGDAPAAGGRQGSDRGRARRRVRSGGAGGDERVELRVAADPLQGRRHGRRRPGRAAAVGRGARVLLVVAPARLDEAVAERAQRRAVRARDAARAACVVRDAGDAGVVRQTAAVAVGRPALLAALPSLADATRGGAVLARAAAGGTARVVLRARDARVADAAPARAGVGAARGELADAGLTDARGVLARAVLADLAARAARGVLRAHGADVADAAAVAVRRVALGRGRHALAAWTTDLPRRTRLALLAAGAARLRRRRDDALVPDAAAGAVRRSAARLRLARPGPAVLDADLVDPARRAGDATPSARGAVGAGHALTGRVAAARAVRRATRGRAFADAAASGLRAAGLTGRARRALRAAGSTSRRDVAGEADVADAAAVAVGRAARSRAARAREHVARAALSGAVGARRAARAAGRGLGPAQAPQPSVLERAAAGARRGSARGLVATAHALGVAEGESGRDAVGAATSGGAARAHVAPRPADAVRVAAPGRARRRPAGRRRAAAIEMLRLEARAPAAGREQHEEQRAGEREEDEAKDTAHVAPGELPGGHRSSARGGLPKRRRMHRRTSWSVP